MKKIILLTAFFLAILIFPLISAEGKIVINQEPNEIYNLGDIITIPVTVIPISDVSGDIYMHLLCGGKPPIEICHDGISLSREDGGKIKECTLPLTKEKIGEIIGTCTIRAYLSKEIQNAAKTEEFKISNILTLQPNLDQKEFEPDKDLLIFGSVLKENGKEVNGFMDIEILMSNSSDNVLQVGTINNGRYATSINLPVDMKAGNYLVKLNAYEMSEDGARTNKGFVNYNIMVKQIPTYLEIALETNKVEPGTNVKAKAILHDQTGEKINSNAILTIKKGTTDIKVQAEKSTEAYLEYSIPYNEPASNWTVFATSNQITAETTFKVIEKEEVGIEMTNETIVFTNKGNIPYNDTALIKIGEAFEEVTLYLKVDESKKYKLSAPDGKYNIEIVSEGESTLTRNSVHLTGKAVGIKDLSKLSLGGFFGAPLVWIFVIVILIAAAFVYLRKKYDKDFYKRIFKKKVKDPKLNNAWENRAIPLSKNSRLETKNKAHLSISIKGNKQEVSLVDIKIKNLKEIQTQKGNAEETLQKIISLAESKKAFIYESQDNLFFIISPSKTKTFKNENIALEIAQDAVKILSSHNKVFKQKINFGISIEYGAIVEKTEEGILKFMGLENFMVNARRIASVSEGEILISEKMRSRLTNVRTEKKGTNQVNAYGIKAIKYHDEAHLKFIKSFVKRNEAEKKKEEASKK